LAAIAIVFDFMNPVLPLWRLFNRGSKLWLDESEAGGDAGHGALIEEARTVEPGLLPLYKRRRDMMMAREPSPQVLTTTWHRLINRSRKRT
jgi:hypothetical protein